MVYVHLQEPILFHVIAVSLPHVLCNFTFCVTFCLRLISLGSNPLASWTELVRGWWGNRGAPPKRPQPKRPATDSIVHTIEQQVEKERPVDYRDRISVVTWLVVFGLGVSLVFSSPNLLTVSMVVLGSPVSFSITDRVIVAMFMACLSAASTQSVIGVHPALHRGTGSRRRTWAFWALPMALTIIATYLLPLAPTPSMQVIGLLASGVLIALALFCLYATVEWGQPGFRRARFVLNVMAYGSALLLFVFIYQSRTRSLLSATVIAITATLLAIEILRNSTRRADMVFTYGAIVGLVLGQATWALNYWPVPALTGGLLLLVVFYLMVGIAQQGLQDRLTGRILLEFALFTLLALILIFAVGPGLG